MFSQISPLLVLHEDVGDAIHIVTLVSCYSAVNNACLKIFFKIYLEPDTECHPTNA